MKKNLIILIIVAVLATIMYLISGYPKINTVGCTLEAKICPDGSAVGRAGPNCEFIPCPTTKSKQMILPSSTLTDKYQCPKTGWIDCMPILTEEKKKFCLPEAINWYKKNCPNFKGKAY